MNLITLLTVDQIPTYWPLLKQGLESTIPPLEQKNPEVFPKIMESLMIGRMQAWLGYEVDGEVRRLKASAVTKIDEDYLSGTRSFYIYSLYGFAQVDKNFWLEGALSFVKYAKAFGCTQIVSLTNAPSLLELAKSLNGSYDQHLVTVPLL